MRFWLPLDAPSGGTVIVTWIESDYYGDIYLWLVKEADADATGYVYAGTGAREYAVAHDAANRAGTVTIVKDTSTRSRVTNAAPGPNLTNTYFTGYCTGAFASALYAFTAAPHMETLRRMKLVLQKYSKADEPLTAFDLTEDAIETGLIEGMPLLSVPRIGLSVSNYRKLPGGPKEHDIMAADFLWTAWVQEHTSVEKTYLDAGALQGTLFSIAAQEQRHWGPDTAARPCMVHDTIMGVPSVSLPLRRGGEVDRWSMVVRLPMTCRFWGGQWQSDPVWTATPGGRYADVTVT